MPRLTDFPAVSDSETGLAIGSHTRTAWRERRIDVLAAGLAICAVPLSIAITETFLVVALVARLIYIVRHHVRLHPPRVFWYWLLWAALEIASWLQSPHIRAGLGEFRHLLLIGALFLILPALHRAENRLAIWRGIFVTASFGSAVLVCGFVERAIRYRHEITAGGDPSFYLRTGGLLHHWMIYSVVEVLVFGALLEFRTCYPGQRRWTRPALAINILAICLSLTRALWLACFVLLAIHLIWRRSKWTLVLPLIPLTAFFAAPGPLKDRIAQSIQSDYYSNAERVQMWAVGWKMIRERPLTGVGAGRVEELYASYLPPGAPVPAYHGHLHNNALQLGAQFGLPVLCAALYCLAVLLKDLAQKCRRVHRREDRFLCRAALIGTAGFVITGMTDYTYGHSLGLILFSFVAISPLMEGNRYELSQRAN